MKKKIISLVLAGAMLVGVASCTTPETTAPVQTPTETVPSTSAETEPEETEPSIMGFNMIDNGDFSDTDPENPWHTYFEGGDGLMYINDKGELQFDCKIVGIKEHSNQIYYDGFSLYQNCEI